VEGANESPSANAIVPNAIISQRFLSNLGPSHQGATANKEIDTTMSKEPQQTELPRAIGWKIGGGRRDFSGVDS